MRILLCFFGWMAVVLSVGPVATAQTSAGDLRVLEVGGAAVATGQEALFANPANLLIGGRAGETTLTLGAVQAFAGGDLLQFGPYNRTLTRGRFLADDDISLLLDDWFGGQQRGVRGYAEAVPVALFYVSTSGLWAIGGAVRTRSLVSTNMDDGLIDLLLRGTGANRTVPVNGGFRAFTMTDLMVTYSRHLPAYDLRLGIAPRVVLGGTVADGSLSSVVDVADEALTHTFRYETRAAGTLSSDVFDGIDLFSADSFGAVGFTNPMRRVSGAGFAVDLGATHRLSERWTVSASVTDLGFVRWSGDAQRVVPERDAFRFDGLDLNLGRVEDEFGGNIGRYVRDTLDSLATDAYAGVVRDRNPFTMALPTTIHFGATADVSGFAPQLLLGLSSPVVRPYPDAPRMPTLHAGLDYQLGIVPLKGGLRFGGDSALAVGLGTGIHTRRFAFDIGFMATPYSSFAGAGGRYALRLSLATVRW